MHRIGRWEVLVKQDLAAWAPDGAHLLGSAMSLPRVTENLARSLGRPEAEILALTRERPMAAIGWKDAP
jgi:N-acetylglucosamine-6-phosphate deacetylase